MRAARKAFTLVEILIVVVILGILAAIVVPQFTSATQDAQGGNLLSQLETMNSQSELFNAKYNIYPIAANATNPWTGDLVVPSGTLTGGMVSLGYLKGVPKNPHNGSSSIGQAATDGWFWFDGATAGGTPIKVWCATNFNNDPEDNTRGAATDADAGTVYGQVIPGKTKLPDGSIQ